MAEVIIARVTGIEGFERHVVIKKIRDDRAGEARFVQMFLDEARLAASLHHNNIVHVHDIGQDNGEYFFTMEYVHGEDLRRVLAHLAERERRLPLDHCVTIALATAAALHHAHEHRGADRSFAGIVHRDVSPANILIAYDGNVKVVDFGIAKLAHRTDETGLMKGKVAYMSPEQCLSHDVDRRSDVFCLGIVLYELVTVRRLFKGANDFLTMSSILHGVIPPPSELRPDLPPELEAIILKALATRPEDRYQTADDMRAALERFATNAKLQTSTTALADFMRAELGERDVPWMVAEEEPELSIDFDGSGIGVVAAPDAAIAAMPALPASSLVGLPGSLPAPTHRRRLMLAAAGAVTAVLAVVAIVIAASSSDDTASASGASRPEIAPASAPAPAPAPDPAPAPPAAPDFAAAAAAEPPPEDWKRNSIGSSMVRTWTGRVSAMWLIRAARVVDLPLPVGPVTSTSPIGRSQKSSNTGGRSRSSTVAILKGMRRNDAASVPRCRKMLPRNRARPWMP
jgi:serine/threonine-protein kinase